MSHEIQHQLRRLQHTLEGFYGLEQAPRVEEFVRLGSTTKREQLLVQESVEGLYVAVMFPEDQIPEEPLRPSDRWTQLIEAVSHFLFLAERARVELPTTQLELELQAEIDKFVVLLPTASANELASDRYGSSKYGAIDPEALEQLHRYLYEDVQFLHAAESNEGNRYRLANQLAATYIARLLKRGNPELWQRQLRTFYRASQSDKISLVLASR